MTVLLVTEVRGGERGYCLCSNDKSKWTSKGSDFTVQHE
jgi:hypothetical protein